MFEAGRLAFFTIVGDNFPYFFTLNDYDKFILLMQKTILSIRNNATRVISFALFSVILHLHYLTWYITFTCILIVLQILYQCLVLVLLYMYLFHIGTFMVFNICTFIVFTLFRFVYSYCFIVHLCISYHWQVSNDINKDVYIYWIQYKHIYMRKTLHSTCIAQSQVG